MVSQFESLALISDIIIVRDCCFIWLYDINLIHI